VQLNISQYTFKDIGESACTVLASSVMQFILLNLKSENLSDIFNVDRLSESMFSGIAKLNEMHLSSGGSIHHLSVDDLGNDFFDPSITQLSPEEIHQGLLKDPSCYQTLFTEARKRSPEAVKYIGIILTKPPETIAIIIPKRTEDDKYFLFDSHPRPEQGLHGSYLVMTSNPNSLIQRLNRIFPSLSGMAGERNNFFADMYHMFEGSFFIVK
jgi:hypothetical protein